MPPRFNSFALSTEERRELLALARRAIQEAVVHDRVADISLLTGSLAQRCGAFVTLHSGGRLRGCIGSTEAHRALAETIVQCAIGAALHDPRFAAVRADEIAGLEIEISVLSALQPLQPQSIEIGTHGLLVVSGAHRGVLLPRVAEERHWSAEKFLDETCRKAGLDAGAWRAAQTQILGFTVDLFSEARFPPSPAASYSSST